MSSSKFSIVFTAAIFISISFFPISVSAQTVSELSAKIEEIFIMLEDFDTRLTALEEKLSIESATTTSATSAPAFIFTRSLSLGSEGRDVVELQKWLISEGFPLSAGATGYFGEQTVRALASWQRAAGISPASGNFGPLTMARLNSILANTGTYTGEIETIGIEGTISAILSPSTTTEAILNENETEEEVMSLDLTAGLSDIKVERIRIDLGNSSEIFDSILSRIHIADEDKIIASIDLDNSNIVREGLGYYVTITGFDYIVRNSSTKILRILVDAKSDFSETSKDEWTLAIPKDGIRGIDGAGINQYAPGSRISRDFSIPL